MGTGVYAECSSCGYSESYAVGGGMNNHLTYAAWPVYCDECDKLTLANYYDEPLTCLRCGSTGVTELNDTANRKGTGEVLVDWRVRSSRDNIEPKWWEKLLGKKIEPTARTLVVTDAHYRCPKCGEFELRFPRSEQRWIMWD